ncbi:MAG TPA: fibronectin type III domain-containing protein, partial [Vicinamibacterales bacterium]|nr:fibronectin type III domain-containing protein [Vicinamibacterales bacterium]
PTGGVFVGGTVVVAGQPRPGPVELDSAGAVTAWTPALAGQVVGTSPGGQLVLAREAVQGLIQRRGLAAFDLTTGGLSSFGAVLDGPSATIDDVRTDGQRVFIRGPFTTVNGQPRGGLAAIDGTTGAVLDWPSPEVTLSDMAAVDASHVYFYSGRAFRRVDSTTGVLDAAWLPPVGGFLAFADGQILVAGKFPDFGIALGTVVGTLDAVTGAYREVARANNFAIGSTPVIDGGTIYIPGNVVPRFGFPPTASAVLAIDRNTGVRVAAPALDGPYRTLTLAAGRLIAGGERMTVNGQYAYGAVEIVRPNAKTSWDSGFRLHGGFLRGLATEVSGDLLAVAGTIGDLTGRTYSRVAAFTIAPSAAPANLRAQTTGATTLFIWDAAVPTPPGGYVIEGGFAPGQAAGAFAVGAATSVALPIPPGPAFIRVRPQGGSEVSNEVVAGCLAPPQPPTALTTSMTGTTVSFAWIGPSDATAYTFSAGTASGLSDAATVSLPPGPTAIGGTVPGGTFFVRVAASNACGTSAPSGEVFLTVGAPDPLPAAPTSLTSSVTGSTLTLSWTAPAGPVTGYVLEAGSAPGLADIGAATIAASTSFAIPGVPAGTYYVRVRAITSAGSGAPSSDVVVVVP